MACFAHGCIMRRTSVTPKRKGSNKLTIREITESKDGYSWTTYLVQGWRESGKWKRRKFKTRSEAEAFIAVKSVELLNADTALRSVVTKLDKEQMAEAETCIARLGGGGRYSLTEAVDYFLQHWCAPDLVVTISDARWAFLEAKEREVRARSLKQLESSVRVFGEFMADTHVHTITAEDVERYLKSLRGRDGMSQASPKTWNNARADLSSFLGWCADPRRRWLAVNPVAHVPKLKVSAGVPETLDVRQCRELMGFVENYRDGQLIPYFALALFTGIRTGGELEKLAEHPDRHELIDLKRGVIRIPPEVSKTRQLRTVTITPNLAAWLRCAPQPLVILPPNHDRCVKLIREKFAIGRDVLRHTFITMHVGLSGSVGRAALEAGNSESVVKRHYLNLAGASEAVDFWAIAPAGVEVAIPGENVVRFG
jgi:integrase